VGKGGSCTRGTGQKWDDERAVLAGREKEGRRLARANTPRDISICSPSKTSQAK